MNLEKLRDAEATFFAQYPQGFDSEELAHIGKRHNVNKMVELANQALTKKKFSSTAGVLEDIVKLVSRSSMVSMFEKPKFRDYVNGLNRQDRELLAGTFQRLLHSRSDKTQGKAFTEMADLLREAKLAKWSLMTICPMYFKPNDEVFVKPTTTKNVINQFGLEDLVYKPAPTWAFYSRYRATIDEMKSLVHPSLSPNNAAFTGFLMMTTSVR